MCLGACVCPFRKGSIPHPALLYNSNSRLVRCLSPIRFSDKMIRYGKIDEATESLERLAYPKLST